MKLVSGTFCSVGSSFLMAGVVINTFDRNGAAASIELMSVFPSVEELIE